MNTPPAIPQSFRRKVLVGLAAAVLLAFSTSNALGQERPTPTTNLGDSPDVHLGNGYDALKQDRYDAAVSEFRAALQLDPKLVLRAQFPLAVALLEMHKLDEARQELEAVRRNIGSHPNISYYFGRLDLEQHNFDNAVRNLNDAIVKPPFPDTAYYLGFAYFKQGNLTAAEKWLKHASEITPQDARVQYQLGFVYRKEGRQEEAKKAFALSDQLRQRDFEESRIKVECEKKLDEGPREEARSLCNELYDPDSPDKLTALGTIYGRHGDVEAALKPLRRAAELAPQSPQVQYNLALAYFQLNRLDDARAPLRNALKRWPDLFQLNALYGAVLEKLGENVPAHEALQHANQLNPQDAATADLLYHVTLVLARQRQATRRYSDSQRYLEQAAKQRPFDPGPHQMLAEIYSLMGHSAKAKSEQREADRLARGAEP